jgi:hypothetical protein
MSADQMPSVEEWVELRAKLDRTLCSAEMGDPAALERIVPEAEELSRAAERFLPQPESAEVPEVDVPGAVEMAHCALINLDNLAKAVPAIARHPMFTIVKHQLTDAIEKLGREV